jgi:hypothetical protein
MRQFLAITLVTALAVYMAMPVWATTCSAMAKVPLCHRTASHRHHSDQALRTAGEHHGSSHCDMAQEQEGENALPAIETAVRGVPGQCPMQCCMQGKAKTSSAILGASFLPVLVSYENHRYFLEVIFARPGFSSHTDRGPPLA